MVTPALNGFIITTLIATLGTTLAPPLAPPSKLALTLGRVTGYFDAVDVAESSRQ